MSLIIYENPDWTVINQLTKVRKRMPGDSLCRQMTSVAIRICYSVTIQTIM